MDCSYHDDFLGDAAGAAATLELEAFDACSFLPAPAEAAHHASLDPSAQLQASTSHPTPLAQVRALRGGGAWRFDAARHTPTPAPPAGWEHTPCCLSSSQQLCAH